MLRKLHVTDCSSKPKCMFSFSAANYSKTAQKPLNKGCSARNQMISLSITSSDGWVQVSLSYPHPPSLPSLMRTSHDPYTLIQLPPYTQGASPLPTSSPPSHLLPTSPPPPSVVPKLSQKVKEGLVFWMTFLVMGLGLLHKECHNYILDPILELPDCSLHIDYCTARFTKA